MDPPVGAERVAYLVDCFADAKGEAPLVGTRGQVEVAIADVARDGFGARPGDHDRSLCCSRGGQAGGQRQGDRGTQYDAAGLVHDDRSSLTSHERDTRAVVPRTAGRNRASAKAVNISANV